MSNESNMPNGCMFPGMRKYWERREDKDKNGNLIVCYLRIKSVLAPQGAAKIVTETKKMCLGRCGKCIPFIGWKNDNNQLMVIVVPNISNVSTRLDLTNE